MHKRIDMRILSAAALLPAILIVLLFAGCQSDTEKG